MTSGRNQCPECNGASVVDLENLIFSLRVDYFRCRDCGCWWTLAKNADEPATRIVPGNSAASVKNRAG